MEPNKTDNKMILVPEVWLQELVDKAKRSLDEGEEEDVAVVGFALSAQTLLDSGFRYEDCGKCGGILFK